MVICHAGLVDLGECFVWSSQVGPSFCFGVWACVPSVGVGWGEAIGALSGEIEVPSDYGRGVVVCVGEGVGDVEFPGGRSGVKVDAYDGENSVVGVGEGDA